MLKKIALAAGIGAAFTAAHAETTIIEDHILATARTPFNSQCAQLYPRSDIIHELLRRECRESLTRKSIGKLEVFSGTVRYSAVMPAPIPESIEKETYVISNCSSVPRREKQTFSVTFEEGSEITVTRAAKSSVNASLTAKFKIHDLTGGLSASHEVSTSEATTTHKKKVVTRTTELDELVPPYTALVLDIEQKLGNAYFDFDGDVRVEAELGKPRFQYSALVPNGLLTVRGQVWNATARSLSKSFRELRLDPATCATALRAEATKSAAAAAPTSEQADDLRAYSRAGAPLKIAPEIVVFRPGMSLQTADLLSAVQVRARSRGPLSCSATFTANNAATSVVAPAGEFGRWHNVAFVTGWSQLLLDGSAQCADGVDAEVRYVKH